ncbi:GCN5-related N-acetyltransferase 6, chloroplastic-like [Amaranthus tricolor]|uniref:GCN5-related N-acetyltransferase 6, chloroplastic-like n=1 Tax=Amaranthus tricolor TaxID=29722 RepID=UPI00258398AC|nr:GCN5-related N-acetyltransferase 6, chloroplastic-like [Amaranthus tricolor]
MEVEFQGTILPQFRAEILPIIKPSNTLLGILKVPSAFGENFYNSYPRWKSLEIHCSNDQSTQLSYVSTSDSQRLPELSFNRLQPTEEEVDGLQRRHFGRFLAREAVLDEEYWTAAWLRAEAHWESVSYMRHVDAHKRKYAEEEFYTLKRRCSGHDGNSLKCFCLVAIKKEDKKIRRTVLNSVVGTLDLSIRQFLRGEKYPGETKKSSGILARQAPFDAHKYAYIANVCVSKFARRQGIAFNLLYLAVDVATANGMKQLYVHVNIDNKAALDLYAKAGFEIVEAASSTFSEDRRFLMLKVL